MATADTLTNDMRHEANTALLEIDKGLRSPRVGEQCEAIVKFPLLIDRFPFPVVINSAFLKIAEVFRTGNNFIRLNIFKVLQLTEKHLQKISSVDEFIRRIYSVMHSNASLARAVTLRVFGSLACIVTERKNIHHSIHHGLESTDKVEVDAAIHATMCLCKHSRTFAMGVCERVMSMIEGLTTPVSMKLQLFPILSLMNHDINTAAQVRELCIKLLPAYPSLCFVSAILHTLTELAVGTLIHLQDQVKLLLYYAGEDARLAVRMKALCNLMRLASQVPHAWTQAMIQDFCSVMENASSESEKSLCARLLYELAGSLAVHNMIFLKDDHSFHALCYSSCLIVSAYTMGVVTHIVITATEGVEEEKKREELEEIGAVVMEALTVHDQAEGGDKSRVALKVMLSSLTLLATSCPGLSESALDALLGILPHLCGVEAVLVCQALASIAAHTPGTWSHVTPTLLDYLNTKTDQHHRIIVPVSTVLMQLHQGDARSGERLSFRDQVSPSLLSHVLELDHPSRFWACYKVARRASMMGFHELAEPIYFKLSRIVTTVKFRNWLNALYQFSLAQAIISSSSSSSTSANLIPSLSKSSSIVYNSIMLVKVSEFSSSFPGSFLSVYSSWLNAHYQLLATCVSFYTLPPPSGNYSSSFFEKKLRKCVSQFQTVSEQCSELYSSLFDADPSTLDYVALLQQSCLLMASIISSIGLARRPLVSPGKVSTPIAETPVGQVEISDSFNTSYLLGKACRTVFQNSQMASSSIQSLPFGGKHAATLIDSSKTILRVPLQLPKYFFNSSQVTSVKLALSPPPPAGGGQHMVTLSPNTHLTLKVEGVVEHSGSELYRSPAAVYIHVTPVLEKLHSSDGKAPVLNSLERMEPVEKDYFEAQFLLELSVPGVYSVLVKASLLDKEGRVWHIGHRAKMTVLAEGGEDPGKSQAKQREGGGQAVPSSSSSSKVGSSHSRT